MIWDLVGEAANGDEAVRLCQSTGQTGCRPDGLGNARLMQCCGHALDSLSMPADTGGGAIQFQGESMLQNMLDDGTMCWLPAEKRLVRSTGRRDPNGLSATPTGP